MSRTKRLSILMLVASAMVTLGALRFGTNVPTALHLGTQAVANVRYGTTLVWTAISPGNDAYTRLLLHCDGTNGQKVITDSSALHYTVSVSNTARLSTAQKKFGATSLYLAGSYDIITVADNDDWDVGGGDFTIDCWVWPLALPNDAKICGQSDSSATASSRQLQLQLGKVGASWFPSISIWDSTTNRYNSTNGVSGLATNTWHHIAAVRDGGILTIYANGSKTSQIDITGKTLQNGSGVFSVGGMGSYTLDNVFFPGYIDEFRVSKGIARWTNNFTPPTRSYGE